MSDLPQSVVDEAVRLTRLAREAADPAEAAAYRAERDRLVAANGYHARVRTSDDVLVCYPSDWVKDGDVQPGRIDDTGRALERSLGGVVERESYDRVAAQNQETVDRIADAYGPIHGANAAAFAAFMANYYTRPMTTATARQVSEFLEEYYPRNVWPTDEQAAVVEDTLRLLFELADRDVPDVLA